MTISKTVRFLALSCFSLAFLSIAVIASAQSGIIYLPVVAKSESVRVPATATPTTEQQVIDLVTAIAEVKDWLARYPGWTTNVYPEDEANNIWKVDFCNNKDCAEWLGYGKVNLNTGAVVEHFVPRELSSEELAAGKPKIEKYLEYDPETRVRQGNPDLWYHDIYWNRWDALWEAAYSYGLEAFTVRMKINQDTGKVELDSFVNPNELKDEDKAEQQRNRARELIWEAEGVGEAVAGQDGWKTYVEHQGGSKYTVAFVADGKQLFSALVDVDAGKVLESGK